MTPEQGRALLEAGKSLLGRFSGPELFHSQNIDLNTPQTVIVQRPLNLNRPLESIVIRLRGRIAVTVANYTAVAPEAIQNIIQRVVLTGTHARWGNLTPLDMSGATLFSWLRMFQAFGADLLINGTRVADPGRPFTTGFLGTTAGSPYDFELILSIPLGPQMGIGGELKRQIINYLYTPQDWGDTLQLQLQFGDESALGDPTGATVAFTSFGAGTGLPLLEIHLNYALLGDFANIVRPGVLVRSEQLLPAQTALANGVQLRLLQKNITPNVVVKSGINQTAGLSTGVQTFASLSDVILDKTQIVLDNKPVRNNQANQVHKSYMARMFSTVIPQGYFLLSFVEGQNPLLAFRGDGVQGAAQIELKSDIISASANNRLHLVQDMIYGGPFPALRS